MPRALIEKPPSLLGWLVFAARAASVCGLGGAGQSREKCPIFPVLGASTYSIPMGDLIARILKTSRGEAQHVRILL